MFLPVKNNDLRVIIKAEDPLNTGIFPDSVFVTRHAEHRCFLRKIISMQI